MQPSELLKALNELYLRFSKDPCVMPTEVADTVVSYLMGKGIAYTGVNGRVCVRSLTKLALELISLGADVEAVSQLLTWRDFEELVSEYLEMGNYHVIKNLRFSAKRYEVDVLGVNQVSSIALVVDCKHWSPGYSKRRKLISVCQEHKLKTEELNTNCSSLMGRYPMITKAKYMVPVVVTLSESVRGFLSGAFIVPILRFNDYIVNIGYYIDLLSGRSGLIKNRCYVGAR